jgi:hypothetical protein
MQRADRRKYHFIYRTDRFDGKFYIGMHSTDDLNDGYLGSGTHLTNSIRYHGRDKHAMTILEFLPTREALKLREKQMITEEMRNNPMCMNLAPGGGGGFVSEEHQQKCASAGGKKSWKASMLEMHTRQSIEKRIATKHQTGVHARSTAKMRENANAPAAMEKRKATFKERAHMQGSKNSQFGTCWVTDGVKPVKIKKEQLEEFLQKGYRRGRSSRD